LASDPLSPALLIERARAGDQDALGRVLEEYRAYLRLLARPRVGYDLRVRVDASDVVQDTLLEAQRDFRQFQGGSEGELAAWLRRILARNLVDQVKHHQSQRRDFHRDQPLESLVEQSHAALAATLSTPSAHARQREQAVVLANAIALLPEEYRQVITLRHVEGRSFQEVAQQMDRSPGAVRMLWMRAIERLGHLVESGDESA
jgi:RNA polymerase sigma-70 factor (ECF subfamily)